jgi:hypothetical protein
MFAVLLVRNTEKDAPRLSVGLVALHLFPVRSPPYVWLLCVTMAMLIVLWTGVIDCAN